MVSSQNGITSPPYCAPFAGCCAGVAASVSAVLGCTDMRVALCLLLLVLGLQQADAAKLDDAAERYRPYMIEGIGSALAGARDLRDRAAANDLIGAKKAWI